MKETGREFSLVSGSDRDQASPFRTRREVNRYLGGRTNQCLICGKRFRRLGFHLAAKHDVTADEYKSRFGLPWTHGLSSAQSRANSGWTEERRAKARGLARESQFFKYAHPSSRREPPEFVKVETPKHLGPHAAGFGKRFDSLVRALFSQGWTQDAIARALDVHRTTVSRRTKQWRTGLSARSTRSTATRKAGDGSNGSSLAPGDPVTSPAYRQNDEIGPQSGCTRGDRLSSKWRRHAVD